MSLKRITDNHTTRTLRFFAGLRRAYTSVSAVEHKLLMRLASRKQCIVEVGVFEGGTSEVFCRAMAPEGRLYLVDPFFPETRLEKLLNVSFTRLVATKTVSPWEAQIEFVRQASNVAAVNLSLRGKADLIFIDARHDYDSVLEDFCCWSPMLADGALIAFHDSHMCTARPELQPTDGPVRLMAEIGKGQHGSWQIVDHADSVTVVRRQAPIE
jgi:predicted O-methyltransferase YrrM